MAAMYGFNATISWCPAEEIKVWENLGRWAVKRGTSQSLNKDGTWGLGDWFASKREAEVAAVLAGMESPEVAELKKANETAQKRLAEKQKVLDQIGREVSCIRDEVEKLRRENVELSACNCRQRDQIDTCEALAEGRPYSTAGFAAAAGAVARLKKDRDQLAGELANLKASRDNYCDQITRLSAEVAKFKGDLAQAIVPDPNFTFTPEDPQGARRLQDCKAIAEGRKPRFGVTSKAIDAVRKLRADYDRLQKDIGDKVYVHKDCGNPRYEARLRSIACCAQGDSHEPADGWAYQAVKRLRADYEAAKRARHYNFSRLESLAAGVVKDGETITDWAAEEIIRLRNHLNACKGIASGDVAVWIGSCAALDAVIKCRHQAVKAENARKALA